MPIDLSKIADKLTAQRAINAVLALAVGYVVVDKIADDDPQRETKLADLGDALAKGNVPKRQQRADNLDTGELHRFEVAIRKACPGSYGLGGALVQPGAEHTTGGNFDLGMRLTAWSDCCTEHGGAYDAARMTCIYSPDAATWAVLASSCEDRDDATWCEVRLRNDAKEPQRPIVFVRRGP